MPSGFSSLLRRILLCGALLATAALRASDAPTITFVLTSDVHFGIARGKFRGGQYVDSTIVNKALVAKLNALPAQTLPNDGGLRQGEAIGPISFVAITGDIANREEEYPIQIQTAATSWGQFDSIWIHGLDLKGPSGDPTQLLVVPGNHDVSNAIGAPTKLRPKTDATSMAQIYNRTMNPAVPLTKDTYDYTKDKVYYSKDIGGAHIEFITMWPDSVARKWIEEDLKHVPETTPVFIFCHDPPSIDARHLVNPNGDHGINDKDLYENLVSDIYADAPSTKEGGGKPDGETTIEQRQLASFLKAHRNIVGYFHGHSNWHEAYTWKGPDNDVALNVFRADSPMKGKDSKDETKLSFEVITYNVGTHTLTDRECLWNSKGGKDTDATPVGWGETTTVSLLPVSAK